MAKDKTCETARKENLADHDSHPTCCLLTLDWCETASTGIAVSALLLGSVPSGAALCRESYFDCESHVEQKQKNLFDSRLQYKYHVDGREACLTLICHCVVICLSLCLIVCVCPSGRVTWTERRESLPDSP